MGCFRSSLVDKRRLEARLPESGSALPNRLVWIARPHPPSSLFACDSSLPFITIIVCLSLAQPLVSDLPSISRCPPIQNTRPRDWLELKKWENGNKHTRAGKTKFLQTVAQMIDKQGPDLRYLRRAIWKGRDFFDSRILIQILDVVMNNFGTLWEQPNFGTSWEQPSFGTSWEQPSFGCSNEVGFFWPFGL